MKRTVLFTGLVILTVISVILASCSTSNSTTTTAIKTITTTSEVATQTTSAIATTTTSKVVSTTSASTSMAGNWWDKNPKPQYGGALTLRIDRDITNFDAYYQQTTAISAAWLEKLFTDNWTISPTVFAYALDYRPNDYVAGQLVSTWEFTDPKTFVMHIRQGIHWQNIPPANGREFTASDVVWNYDRMYGLGGGFTKGSPVASQGNFALVTSLLAPDKYTVVSTWNTSNPELVYETIEGPNTFLVNPEAVQLWGDVTDWHHAIGTGPYILKDLVSGSAATLVKNPNYWGYDERYPQNQLPYIDTIKYLIIPDAATALAALRTHKIDLMDGISLQNSQIIQKTNPEILQLGIPKTAATDIDPRNDVKPFNDVRVRQAMQMAIDLPTIASTFYGGSADPYPATLTSINMTGWGFPYTQWPQDLKDQYAYNPTAAKALLAQAGFPSGFNTDIVADASGDMDLLQIVKSYFAAVGINMDIRVMDSASWSAFVQIGRKHDQLAQKQNGTLGLSFEPLYQFKRFTTNYPVNYMMVSDPAIDGFYAKALAATSLDDMKKLLRDANEYVARQHFVISLLTPKLFALYQPWLNGYKGQASSFSGVGGGPLFLGFYAARVWINQDMKKTMGF